MKTEQRIIKYLDNELTAEEKSAFEKEMESSVKLREDFQRFVSVKEEIEKLKDSKLNPDYLDSILPEFHNRVQTGKKEAIRKSLSYVFGVMLIFIISIAVLRIFFTNHSDLNNIEEFTESLDENQKVELLEKLNSGPEVYYSMFESEIVNLLESDLVINNKVAEAYDIGYKEIIVNLSDNEIEIVYQEILNKNFLEEVPL